MSDAYLQRLYDQRKNIEDRFNEILDAAAKENRDLTAEEDANLKTAQEDMANIKSHVDDILKTRELAKSIEPARAVLTPALVASNERGLASNDAEGLYELITGKRAFLESRFSPEYRAALDSSGGSAIATTFADFVSIALVTADPTYRISRKYPTTKGNPVVVPQVTARSAIAVTAEGSSIGTSNPTLAPLTLYAFKYPVLVDFTYELERDEIIGLDSVLGQQVGIAAGTAMGSAFALGTGTLEPTGFVHAASTGATASVTTASGTGFFDWLDCIALKNSVPAPYRDAASAAWQVSNGALTKMQQFRDSNGAPLWYNSTVPGVTDTFAGRPVYENPAMAAVGSVSLSVAFGDWNQYIIRTLPIRTERSTEWQFGSDIITLKTVFTVDGNILPGAASNAIRLMQSYNT
jgi:HK97 family phage major capsid protein